MGKRLCLTFSVYYFVHPYNITALMICQHVFLNIYIFYRKIVTENGVNSNVLLIVYPIFPAYSCDIIVHVFDEENRLFYDLERIWRDGKVLDVNEFLEK